MSAATASLPSVSRVREMAQAKPAYPRATSATAPNGK